MKKMKTESIKNIKTEVSRREGGCNDKVKVEISIKNDRITRMSITASKSSCKGVKEAALLVKKHINNKHISSVYRLSDDVLGKPHEPNHGASFVLDALRKAVLDYESEKATSSLREVIEMLSDYDKDFVPKDPKYNFEE